MGDALDTVLGIEDRLSHNGVAAPAPVDTHSVPAPLESGLAGIEYSPIPLSELGPSKPPPWMWEGYIARGYTTLLTGLFKAGKTTLLSHMLRDLERGGPLIAEPSTRPVLVLSEEASGHWRGRRDKLSLGDRIHLQSHPFLGRPSLTQWHTLIELVSESVATDPGYGLVVFDTLPSLWPLVDENDASAMLATLTPLRRITQAGAAVLLMHHPRKGDATEGRAARGSGALPGFVDVIVELRRFTPDNAHDRRRVLTAYGRFDDVPPEAVLELGDDGYRVVGDKATVSVSDRREAIVTTLPTEPPGLTAEELHEAWPTQPRPGLRTIKGDLNAEWHEERLGRGGGGKKGDPYRFWRPGIHSGSPTPLGTGNESKGATDGLPF